MNNKRPIQIPEGTPVKCDNGEIKIVIYRSTALKEGWNRFFTGRKCIHKHMSERRTKSYICIECAKIKNKKKHKYRMSTEIEYRETYLRKRNIRHKRRYREDLEYRKRCVESSRKYRDKDKHIDYLV